MDLVLHLVHECIREVSKTLWEIPAKDLLFLTSVDTLKNNPFQTYRVMHNAALPICISLSDLSALFEA